MPEVHEPLYNARESFLSTNMRRKTFSGMLDGRSKKQKAFTFFLNN